jgi:hypothetical protein
MDHQARARTTSSAITLVEAFRRFLRALYPQRPELANEIANIRWFHNARSNGVPDEENAAARAAFEKVNSERQSGRIRLLGSLNGEPPAEINSIDATAPRYSLDPIANVGFTEFSDLKVFEGTLEIHHRGVPQRIYRQVHCIEDDVDDIVRELAPKTAIEQPPTEDTLARTMVVAEPQLEPARLTPGRPELYDWEDFGLYAMKLLKEKGDPTEPKNQVKGWQSQEDFVRAVVDYAEKRLGEDNGPDVTTVRRRAPDWLDQFRNTEALAHIGEACAK